MAPDDRPTRPVDRFSLVVGVALLGLALAFAAGGLDDPESQVRVVWPVVVLAAGVGIVAAAGRR